MTEKAISLRFSPMEGDGTVLRNQASDLAPTNWRAAREIAQKIDDPWFRCQALAYVAAETPDIDERSTLIDESFAVAVKTLEPNRVVTVSAWPLKVLCVHGDISRVTTEVERLLSIIAVEPNPIRRSDALWQVLGAIYTGPSSIVCAVLEPFVRACLEPLSSGKRNGRGASNLCRVMPLIAKHAPDQVEQLLTQLGPTLRARAIESLKAWGHRAEEWCAWPNICPHRE